MRARSITSAGLLAVVAVLSARPATAKPNITRFPLEYRPTGEVEPKTGVTTPDLTDRPVRLEFVDARVLDDPAWIGTRSDDDDVIHDLTASNDVAAWAQTALRTNLERVGFVFDARARRTLEIALIDLRVTETNQAVGANYESTIRFRFVLRDAEGRWIRGGKVFGGANRYGKKFSAANSAEVLSDGIVDTVGAMLAIDDAPVAPVAAAQPDDAAAERAARPPVSPSELLEQVGRMLDGKVSSDTMIEFIERYHLTRAATAEDVVDWKKAGVPEPVLRALLRLPVVGAD